MGDSDGVKQVKEEDDGVVELGRGHTCVYIEDDEYGVGQVKNQGEDVRASWRLDTHRHQLVMPSEACMRVCRLDHPN